MRDNGAGIARELRARVFEPFYRGRPESNGLGLGLALAAAIVAQVGGSIWTVEPQGGGAELRFSWPTQAAVPER